MREFSKISPALWVSKRFTCLGSDDAKLLFLYYLTCEHQNSAGVFRLKDDYAIADLSWSKERYVTAREELLATNLIRFDEGSTTILIIGWFKHNAPMNESHYKGVVRVLQRIDCEELQLDALKALHEAYEAKKAAKATQPPKHPEDVPDDVITASGGHISAALKANLARKKWDT